MGNNGVRLYQQQNRLNQVMCRRKVIDQRNSAIEETKTADANVYQEGRDRRNKILDRIKPR